MNSLERLRAAVAFKRPDRTPVILQIFAHAAVITGVPMLDYLRDGRVLARCQIEAWRRYGGDALFAFMDAGVETEAMGSILRYVDNRYPEVASYRVAPDTTIEGLPEPDPARAGRMPEQLRAASLLRAEVGDEALVVGVALGPMSLATQLMGIEAALQFALDEPHRFEALLDFATGLAIRYGLAQIGAGAHLPMVFDPAASTAVVPPSFFRELLLPRLQRVFQAYKHGGAVLNWLHIAGPVEPILSHYPEVGVDIANLDFEVDPARAARILPHTCLDGNIKPLLFVQGSPDEVAAESRRLMALLADRGGFILSSGCEIPPEAKPENVAAMVTAATERG